MCVHVCGVCEKDRVHGSLEDGNIFNIFKLKFKPPTNRVKSLIMKKARLI